MKQDFQPNFVKSAKPIYSLISESLQAKSCYLPPSTLIYCGEGSVVLSRLSNIKRRNFSCGSRILVGDANKYESTPPPNDQIDLNLKVRGKSVY